MAQTTVRQYAGDIRFWEIGAGGIRVPVIPEPADPDGNQPVETNSFSFSYEAGEQQQVLSARRGARYQQPTLSRTLPGVTSVTAVLTEVPPLILARMLFGEGSTATVTAGSVVDANFTVTATDVPLQLPHRMLLASPAPTVEKGAATLVAGTDYTIDLRRGQILPLAGGDIEADDVLVLNYSYAAHVATSIVGGAVPTKDFYITGDMEDRNNAENGELRLPKASLTTDGEVDWLSVEPITVTLTGPCIVADGETAPYTFVAYK